MASIKDVAAKAQVSISTVSIIINGKSKERKISKETQEKVLNAMKELNYQPNLSAKKLRIADTKKTIALFWTTDFRGVMLARFLDGLHEAIKKSNYNFDIIIYTYENNQLCKEEALTKLSNFHGAIIANASEKDLEYLSSLNPMFPIVLYNRQLVGYSSVSVDDSLIAEKIYHLIKDKNNIGIIKAPYAFKGMSVRDQHLVDLLTHHSIQEYTVTENSIESGYSLASCIDFKNLDVLYTASDMIAAGIMHYCYKNHIVIPDDIEIVSIGNGLTHVDAFLNPSLSIIEIPLEKMAGECLHVLNQLFSQSLIINKSVEPQTIVRESLK
ncbi:LacI family DNA-binding transcriptional regulator [Faecalibacillus faecis]|uniref:LacI family DNA-binding transcriptional regulator n=1 Tax=Faecalibacillus faecis TaxID=1982628 RepID=UPI0022E9261A|nr:LacI family DNA-binding transcriptional regulator [Faecalibacillus faecis]